MAFGHITLLLFDLTATVRSLRGSSEQKKQEKLRLHETLLKGTLPPVR